MGREMKDGNRRECVQSDLTYNKLQIDTHEFQFDRVFNQESY